MVARKSPHRFAERRSIQCMSMWFCLLAVCRPTAAASSCHHPHTRL